MFIGKDTIEMYHCSLYGKGGKEARAILEDLCKQTGISLTSGYRITEGVRLSDRAVRKDKGRGRIEIPPEALDWMIGMGSKYDLPAEDVIELAELNGLLQAGQIKPQTYNAWLHSQDAARSRFKKDVRPYTPWEAPAPNILHHYDTTKLEEIHYDPKTDLLTWNPRANRKNSRGEKPDSIWLYSMVDDHSRAKFPFLYRSENQYNHLDFLYRAWSEKKNPSEFPFYGTPRHLYMDLGPVNKSIKVMDALHKLGVHVIPTKASTSEEFGSRKHGKVENPFKTYGKWLRRMRPRLESGGLLWEEAQESLYQFSLKLNNKVHSATGAIPFGRWMTIDKPAHMPNDELWQILKHEHDSRIVKKDLTISVNNHLYRLPEKRPFIDWVGQGVEVYWLKDNYEKVFAVRGATEVELKEIADLVRPAFHYDHSEKEMTTVDEIRKRAGERNYSGVRLWATDERRVGYLPRDGEAFDEKRIAEKTVETPEGKTRPSFAPMRWLNKFDVKRELAERGVMSEGKLSDAERLWLANLMDGRSKISEEEVDEAAKKAKAQTPEDVAGGE